MADLERDPTWVLLSRPGMCVQRKGPFYTGKLVEQMVRDLYALHPGATCIVVNGPLTLDPTDGREWVSMFGDRRRKPIPPTTAGVAASGDVQAWQHEEDPARVISAIQKAQALRDGGASASSVKPYSVPLTRGVEGRKP